MYSTTAKTLPFATAGLTVSESGKTSATAAAAPPRQVQSNAMAFGTSIRVISAVGVSYATTTTHL